MHIYIPVHANDRSYFPFLSPSHCHMSSDGEQKRTAGRAVKTALNFIVVIGDRGAGRKRQPAWACFRGKKSPSAY